MATVRTSRTSLFKRQQAHDVLLQFQPQAIASVRRNSSLIVPGIRRRVRCPGRLALTREGYWTLVQTQRRIQFAPLLGRLAQPILHTEPASSWIIPVRPLPIHRKAGRDREISASILWRSQIGRSELPRLSPKLIGHPHQIHEDRARIFRIICRRCLSRSPRLVKLTGNLFVQASDDDERRTPALATSEN